MLPIPSLLRSFPYREWLGWRLFWGPLPVLFYFREIRSLHLLPVLFDATDTPDSSEALQSELFAHRAGTFDGAVADRAEIFDVVIAQSFRVGRRDPIVNDGSRVLIAAERDVKRDSSLRRGGRSVMINETKNGEGGSVENGCSGKK